MCKKYPWAAPSVVASLSLDVLYALLEVEDETETADQSTELSSIVSQYLEDSNGT